jgi:hypothetical protein
MGISSSLGSSALLPAGLGFRNVIINGDMRVHQRGGTTTVTTANGYNVDRWYGYSSGTFTMQQSTDVPISESFSNSVLLTCTVADASIAAGDFNSISQRIEGHASASIGYGTSNKTNVLSFWVKSSLTGTYCVSFRNNAVNRSYVAEYTINSADTWEKKVIYLTSDIVGTWEKTNGIGVRLDFSLAMGTNFHTTPNVWASGSFTSTSNQVNWMSSSSSRTFYLTGVQLEQNYQPTPFEQRPIGVELALCQRYYFRYYGVSGGYSRFSSTGGSYSNTSWQGVLNFPTTMRATPSTIEFSGVGCTDNLSFDSTAFSSVTFSATNTHPNGAFVVGTGGTNINNGVGHILMGRGGATAYIGFSAEL